MQNRFYVVGTPIEDLQGNLFLGVNPKSYTQDELEKLSFYKQDKIRVFNSYDQAKEYAHGLRENAYDYSHFPKTALNRSKVRPVFTIELNLETKLGELNSETFKYNEHYVDDDRYAKTREKEVELNFYEIDSNLVNKSDIVRAEFYRSRIAPVEFVHTQPSKECVLF
ncbi:MAG: hypothetical protein KIT56_07250 [Gammaproteobacteria bacterium]|nr:hypothetical protein [Gammaproteobacteria bacterium]MCW5583656.1 hypothetical protein [Gammaproteobacteria bacterium]